MRLQRIVVGGQRTHSLSPKLATHVTHLLPPCSLPYLHAGLMHKLWHSNEYIQRTSWVLLTLNSYYLYDAVHQLLEANKIQAATCESQTMHLYFQRNALISGGR